MSLPQIVVPGSTSFVGSEFQVNAHAPGTQALPSITALADGGWLVVWMSGGQDGSEFGVYGQRYDSGGTPVGSEFQANTFTSSDQYYPSAAALADGGYVVTWMSAGQDEFGFGIYGQRYHADGTAAGTEFRINTGGAGDENNPSVVGLSDGGWVTVWGSRSPDTTQQDVLGQRYNASGVAVGGEFQVTSSASFFQWNQAITALSDGGWLVTWMSLDQDGSGYGIYGRRYASDGAPAGAEFQVNTATVSDQTNPSVATLTDGGWIVVWDSLNQDGSLFGVFGQRYAADGTVVDSEFQVNTFTSDRQWYPTVAPLQDGGWVVTWGSNGQDGSSFGIYSQRYSADGLPSGGELQINSFTTLDQNFPTVTTLLDGSFVITWTSFGQDGSEFGVFGQQLSPFAAALPEDIVEDATLNASAVGVMDPDGMGVVSWQWQRSTDGGANWVDIDGADEQGYTPGDADVGQLLRLKGAYIDGLGNPEEIFSSASTPVLNVNDMPVNFAASVYGRAEEGDVLTVAASVGSDADGLPDPLTFTYQWQVSTDGSVWSDLDGETGSTYTPDADDIGSLIRAQASFSDGQGTQETANSAATAAIFAAGTSLQLTANAATVNDDALSPQLSMLPFADSGEMFLRATSFDADGATYELVVRPIALSGSVDFLLTGLSPLDNFALTDALDGWTVEQSSPDSTSISVSGMGAVDESDHLQAGAEVVIATFSVAGAPDALLSSAEIGGRGVAAQSVADVALQSDTTGDFVGTFAVGASGLVQSSLVYDNSARAVGAQDALEALRLAVGLDTSQGPADAYDFIAADFNRDGRVGAQDALEILRFAVGLNDALDTAWVFVDAAADLSGIDRLNVDYDTGSSWVSASADTDIALVGVLLGDVNDSFSPV